MNLRKLFVLSLFVGLCSSGMKAQQGVTNELGLITGPVFFKSDYGLRNNHETNFGNVGFGIGVVHYLNFNYYSGGNYFNEHFKIRNELDYHVTKLDHYGKEAKKESLGGKQLRAMHGKAKVIEFGSALEWYPLNISDFQQTNNGFAPYVSLGVHFVFYTPEAKTDLPGKLGAVSNTFYAFLAPPGEAPYINTDKGTTYAFTGSAGVRYKLSPVSDLQLDLRLHYYGSDFVDGLDHDNPQNKANDWIFWINVGYIYYLDF